MIARETENKAIGWKLEDNVAHNSAISPADCIPVVQEIADGTNAQQRVGDRVKPKSLKVSGVVSFDNNDLNTSQDIYVRVVIAAQKNIKVGSAVTGGVDTDHLLRPAFAGLDQIAFDGNTLNLNMPINKELFRVYYDKIHKLTSAQVSTGIVGFGSVEANAGYSKRWSYKFKKLPASLTYDDGNGDWANNFAPFLAIGYAFSDGTAPDTVTTRIRSSVTSLLEYEDA